jgi:hypothetical protein
LSITGKRKAGISNSSTGNFLERFLWKLNAYDPIGKTDYRKTGTYIRDREIRNAKPGT